MADPAGQRCARWRGGGGQWDRWQAGYHGGRRQVPVDGAWTTTVAIADVDPEWRAGSMGTNVAR